VLRESLHYSVALDRFDEDAQVLQLNIISRDSPRSGDLLR
jgi:hypothetical protein